MRSIKANGKIFHMSQFAVCIRIWVPCDTHGKSNYKLNTALQLSSGALNSTTSPAPLPLPVFLYLLPLLPSSLPPYTRHFKHNFMRGNHAPITNDECHLHVVVLVERQNHKCHMLSLPVERRLPTPHPPTPLTRPSAFHSFTPTHVQLLKQ